MVLTFFLKNVIIFLQTVKIILEGIKWKRCLNIRQPNILIFQPKYLGLDMVDICLVIMGTQSSETIKMETLG